MLLLFLLLSILALSLAVYYWLGDTPIARGGLRYIYAPFIAMIFISVLYDFSLVICLSYRAFLILSTSIGLGLLYYLWRQGINYTQKFLMPGFYSLAALVLIYYLSYIFIQLSVRWGRTDARAIWSLHALFLMDGQHWKDMFTSAIFWSHPDYPLLLSSWIAIFWKAIGNADPLVPCLIAYFTFLAVLTALSAALRDSGKYMAGIIALLVFAWIPAFAQMASFQAADTLLSLFFLMTFILARQRASAKLVLLTGFIAGFAGWAKNEGLAFTLIFSIAMTWQHRKAPVKIIYYIAGLALPLIIISIFKINYSTANDLVAGQNLNTLQKLQDVARYRLTGVFFGHNATELYPPILALMGMVVVTGYRKLLDIHLLVLLAMLALYYFIFITTPRELPWHLETASSRLFLQLFPAFVYVLTDILGE